MFSRREVQTRIDEIAKILTAEQAKNLVGRLNSTERASIEAFWELMWISALSRHGTVRHEPALPGGKRFPDIHFEGAGIAFVADVATVSDQGYEEENPTNVLREEMSRLYKKHKVLGGFSIQVQSKMEGEYRDQKVRVLLPPRAELRVFLQRNFEPMIRAVSKSNEERASCRADVPGGGLIIVDYEPGRRPINHGPGHLSCDVPYSLRRNPVSNVLKAKKKQLSDTNFNGLKGIILCDGDCTMLSTKMKGPHSHSPGDIISDVLRQNSSIGFVLSVGVESLHNPMGNPRTILTLLPRLYRGRDLDPEQERMLLKIFDAALREIPTILRTPQNAVHRLRHGSPVPVQYSDYYSYLVIRPGDLMNPYEIKLSARTLTSLLGGEITLNEFREHHSRNLAPGRPPLEPLRQVLEEGRKLETVHLEPMPGEDDDLVVLNFGKFDPAKVRFRAPETG